MRIRDAKADLIAFAVVFILSASLLFTAGWYGDYIYMVFNAEAYLSWHVVLELLSIIMSFCIFLVGYYTERTYRLRKIIQSSVFLAVAMLDTFHTLSYSGMPLFIVPSSAAKATTFWIAARLTMAVGMLVAGAIDSRKTLELKKPIFFIAPVLWSGILFYIIAYHIDKLPPLYIEGVGLTSLKKELEYFVIVLLGVCMVLFARSYLKNPQGRKGYSYTIMALLISMFSGTAFTMYADVYDTYNLLGHIYKIISYYLLFKALFVLNVQRPYLELHDAERKLSKFADNLQKLVEERTAEIAAANEKLMKDLDYARNIQNALLPDTFPKATGLEFAVRYLPCETIGGDYYNVYKLDDENTGILIGDVAGHGVYAAMITVFINQNINVRRVYDDGTVKLLTPKQVLTNLYYTYNLMSFPDESYIVLFYGIYNRTTGTLTYCSAGMNMFPLILKRNGAIERIKLEGLPICRLGRLVNPAYENRTLQLDSGDSLILFTDGLTEIDRNNPELSSEANIIEFLRGMTDTPADDIVMYMLDAYYAMLGDRERIDDVTVLVAKVE